MKEVRWRISREWCAWSGEEDSERFQLTPEKIEMVGGKLFWSDEERLTMLALLLENVGIANNVKIGDLHLA